MSTDPSSYVVYDGKCPVCSRYVRMLRLQDSTEAVELLDAREEHPLSRLLLDKSIDLDEGMVLVQGDQISQGADCVRKLALFSTPSNPFNRVNSWIFQSATASRLLYPVMRCGRNAVLMLFGRKKLSQRR